MGKHDRRETSGQSPDSRPVTIQVPLPVLGVVHGVREAFHGLCIATGLQVLEAMMEADRAVLCGPKGRHQVERPAWRGGSVESPVTLGGRQVEVPRLRVRSADGEVPLVSFQWAAVTDPLDEHTLAAVAAGVSTRRYAGTLDPVPVDVTERATSSSAVSRRFVALSTKRLDLGLHEVVHAFQDPVAGCGCGRGGAAGAESAGAVSGVAGVQLRPGLSQPGQPGRAGRAARPERVAEEGTPFERRPGAGGRGILRGRAPCAPGD